MLWGITAWHVNILCGNTFEGGYGYSPAVVGDMTLDQIFMVFTERKLLRSRGTRTQKMESLAAPGAIADKDGRIRGVATDGSRIEGRIGGKSKARMLMEQEQKKKRRKGRKRG